MPPILTVICGLSYAVLVATPLSPPPDAEDKLRGIRLITDAALSYLGADEFLTALLSRVKESLDADTAAVLLLDRSARQLMRSALRAYALETRDPAEVLSRLDRKIQHFEPAAMATVSYAVLEPATGHMRISAAGHFRPWLLLRDGAATWPTSRAPSTRTKRRPARSMGPPSSCSADQPGTPAG